MKFLTFKLILDNENNLKDGNLNEQLDEYYNLSIQLPDNSEIHNDLGIIYALSQNYTEAFQEISTALKLNPTLGKALNNRAIIIQKQLLANTQIYSDFSLALSYVNEEEKITIYYNWGLALLKCYKYKSAANKFAHVLQLDPNHQKALIELGGALAHTRPHEAIQHLKQILVYNSQNGHVFNYLGYAYCKIDQVKNGIAAFSHALLLECKDEDINLNLGKSYYILGEYNMALIFLNKAARSNIISPKINFQIGLMQIECNQYDLAKIAFERVIKIIPNSTKALLKLASIHLVTDTNDRLGKAEGLFRKALEYDAQSFDASFGIGKLKLTQNKLVDAQTYLQQAVHIDPHSCIANYFLGSVLYKRYALADAHEYFTHALSLNANYIEAHIGLAEVKLKLGDKLGAILHFRKVLEMQDTNVVAQNGIGTIYMSQGYYDNAQYYFSKTLQTAFANIEANLSCGIIEYYKGKYKLAQKYFNAILYRTWDHYEASLYNAYCYMKLKDIGNAIYFFKNALRQNPDNLTIRKHLHELSQSISNVLEKEAALDKNLPDTEDLFLFPPEDNQDSPLLISDITNTVSE